VSAISRHISGGRTLGEVLPESKFTPEQAEELAAAFAREKVVYLFIGKSGAILLGYPETTQDVDIFLPRSRNNARGSCARCVRSGLSWMQP
jgi:hypothetical protein